MQNSAPILSVGHLCYNTGPYVLDAIKSIQASDLKEIEQIVLDDCSTDGSADLISDFIEKNGLNVRFIQNKTNLGINASKNKIIAEASGKYYYGIGDDLILPNKLGRDLELLEKSDDSVFGVCSLSQIFYENPVTPIDEYHGSHRGFLETTTITADQLLKSLVSKNWIAAPTVVLKMAWLKNFEYPSDYFIEDYPFWVMSALQGKAIIHRPEVSVLYRRGEDSISRQHYKSLTALKIAKDSIRCRLLALDALGEEKQRAKIIRDGINILQYGDTTLQKWYRKFIVENNCRGIIYYGSFFSKNNYFLRALWFLSRLTRNV